MVEDKSLKFKYWDHTGTTLKLIKSWKPEGCKTHKQYQNSLYKYLKQRLKDVNDVIKEDGLGRFRGDIGLDGKLIVEIKVNLDKTAEFQRTIGQIEGYLKKDKGVIVVVCGRKDKNFLAELEKKYEELNMWETKFAVVEK